MKCPLNILDILYSSGSDCQCQPVSSKAIWSKPFSNIIFLKSDFFPPLWDSGRFWMLMKPKRMFFLDSFQCRWSPKCVFSYLASSFTVGFFSSKVLLDRMDRLHCPLLQLGPFCLELLLIVFFGLAGVPYFCGGDQVLVGCHCSIFIWMRRIWDK